MSRLRVLRVQLACVAALLSAGATAAQAGKIIFRPLAGETSPEGSNPYALSSDGSTIVGEYGLTELRPAYWTYPEVTVNPIYPPTSNFNRATAVSGDGSVIIGFYRPVGEVNIQPFRWSEADGLTQLPFSASGVNGDGSIIVGATTGLGGKSLATVWDGGPTPIYLDPGAPGANAGASHISDDGQVIVGGVRDVGASLSRPVVWFGDDAAPTPIPLLPGGQFDTVSLTDLSPNGEFAVGRSVSPGFRERSFIWSSSSGTRLLPKLYWADAVGVSGVSNDGRIVVGTASRDTSTGVSENAVVVMADGRHWRTINELLSGSGNPTGWLLYEATGVSADGRTIVGRGINPKGRHQAWAITVPEPSASVLMAVGIVVAGVVGQRRRLRSLRRL